MQEKGMQKVWKMMPKGSQNGSQNLLKNLKMPEKKTCRNHANNLSASVRRCPWGAAVSLCVHNAFWYHFLYFLHAFFLHRFGLDFESIFHDFLSAWNDVSIVKQIVSSISAFFRKVWKFVDLGIHFGIIFDHFWH